MVVLEYVRRYLWVVRWLTVVFCAYLAANAVSIYIRGKLMTVPTTAASAAKTAADAYVPLTDYDIILKRSIFYTDGANPLATFGKTLADVSLAVNSDFSLIGTMAGHEELSYAVVRLKSNNETEVVQVGDQIGGNAYVVAIRPREIEILDAERSLKKIPLLEGTEISGAGGKGSSGEPIDIAKGITQMGDGEFKVDQKIVEDTMENPFLMMRGGAAVPKVENGRIVGFQVKRIRPNSFYAKIGLKDGDIIHRINSVELNSPEGLLSLFTELRAAKSIAVDVTRDNQRQTLNYEVR